jgi:hypothetical protein
MRLRWRRLVVHDNSAQRNSLTSTATRTENKPTATPPACSLWTGSRPNHAGLAAADWEAVLVRSCPRCRNARRATQRANPVSSLLYKDQGRAFGGDAGIEAAGARLLPQPWCSRSLESRLLAPATLNLSVPGAAPFTRGCDSVADRPALARTGCLVLGRPAARPLPQLRKRTCAP